MLSRLNKEILKGKSLGRSLVNAQILAENIKLTGRVLDLGSSKPSGYLRFFKFDNVEFLRLDKAQGADYNIDFEKDRLPFEKESVDAVLCFNLFEHIYNYQFLAQEMFQVLKSGGTVIGSVPFLIRIHPDPNDFFRYTQHALENIFQKAGFKEVNVKQIGFGPFTANYAQLQLFLPKKHIALRPLRFLLAHSSMILDKGMIKLKPIFQDKFPLEYFFILKK